MKLLVKCFLATFLIGIAVGIQPEVQTYFKTILKQDEPLKIVVVTDKAFKKCPEGEIIESDLVVKKCGKVLRVGEQVFHQDEFICWKERTRVRKSGVRTLVIPHGLDVTEVSQTSVTSSSGF